MKKLLLILINILGVVFMSIGLWKLCIIQSAYDPHLWLWWIVYLVTPLTVMMIDLKYFDKVFEKDLYLKK